MTDAEWDALHDIGVTRAQLRAALDVAEDDRQAGRSPSPAQVRLLIRAARRGLDAVEEQTQREAENYAMLRERGVEVRSR
jgi:hypothetical protein